MIRFISFVLFGTICLASCTHGPVSEAEPDPPIHNFTVGKWINRHAGDPDLAGVRVQQFPDCGGEAQRYEGKHPAMILFVFKDGRVNQVGYKPDGAVHEDFWWSVKPDDYLWSQIDRSVASVVIDERDFVPGELPDAEQYERVIQIGPRTSFKANVGVTTKGNGVLTIANLRLKVWDAHDDGEVFEPHLLHVEFVDVTGDGYRDILICGALKHTGDTESEPASIEPVAYLYVYEPKTKSFACRYGHGPELEF